LQLEVGVIVQDFDGNIYSTVKIGDQRWMSENLRTTRYNDGTPLLEEQNNTNWDNLTTPAYCWYSNDSLTYSNPYGALYNYYAVADTNSLNVCPVGWHVPTDGEWTTLTDFLGGTGVAGGKMKSTGTIQAGPGLWQDPNTGATNESGFSGLPGGRRGNNGTFFSIGNVGYWRSSTENEATNAWTWTLFYFNDIVFRQYFNKEYGFSVRCLRD